VQLDGDFSLESSVERLGQGISQGPFDNHMIAAHNDFVGLQRRIWVELALLPEKFSQPAWVIELQSQPPGR